MEDSPIKYSQHESRFDGSRAHTEDKAKDEDKDRQV